MQQIDTCPMLRIASGIDYDPLPEGKAGETHVYPPGEKVTALTEGQLRDIAARGFSVVQIPSADFFNYDTDENGQSDMRGLDDSLAMLARFDLEALVVASFYWIPPCLRDDPRAIALRCVDHDESIPIFSIWNPFTFEWIEKSTQALAEKLADSPATVRGIQISLCGDFGEAIFPAGMMNVGPFLSQTIKGEQLHNHSGYWCNDPCARQDYVRYLQEGGLPHQDRSQPEPDAADLFPKPPAAGDYSAAWVAFLQWYRDSMTRYAGNVFQIFRKHMPDYERVIYLGGGTEPHTYGQDNTALPRAMKTSGGTVRSTASGAQMVAHQAEGSPATLALAFQKNYPLVKRIATACHYYDVPLWLEPPYPQGLNRPGTSARMFEAISCGAAGFFEWTRTLQRQKEVYEKCADRLICQKPRVDVALYFPSISHFSNPGDAMPELFWEAAAAIRAVADYDVVDDLLIDEGALDRYAIVVLPQIDLLQESVFNRIRQWVQAGGIALARDTGPLRLVDGCRDDQRAWFGMDTETDPASSAIRQKNGKGFSLFCPASGEPSESLVPTFKKLILTAAETQDLSTRQAIAWTGAEGSVFATVFHDSILLANLTPEFIQCDNGQQAVDLDAYEMTSVPQ